LASRYRSSSVFESEEQLRDAPLQLQGYVAGIVAFLRADPTAASAVFTAVGGSEYKTVIFTEAYSRWRRMRAPVLRMLIT
jgi:hypothetical protein